MAKNSIDPKKLYSAKDAAGLLNIGAETVKKYCGSGKLKGKQIGPKKVWHVPGSEILRLKKEWGMD